MVVEVVTDRGREEEVIGERGNGGRENGILLGKGKVKHKDTV